MMVDDATAKINLELAIQLRGRGLCLRIDHHFADIDMRGPSNTVDDGITALHSVYIFF